MNQIIKNFWKDEEGATAIEYGLIAGLIAVVIIGGVTALGEGIQESFCKIANAIKAGSCAASK